MESWYQHTVLLLHLLTSNYMLQLSFLYVQHLPFASSNYTFSLHLSAMHVPPPFSHPPQHRFARVSPSPALTTLGLGILETARDGSWPQMSEDSFTRGVGKWGSGGWGRGVAWGVFQKIQAKHIPNYIRTLWLGGGGSFLFRLAPSH